MKKKQMLNAKSVSKLLDTSLVTVLRWAHQGKIPSKLIRGEYLFIENEIIKWAKNHNIRWEKPIKEQTDCQTIPQKEAPIELLKALKNGGIIRHLKGNDLYSVLKNAVDHLRLLKVSDKKMVFEQLLNREETASTGIGKGIAIPHPRNPLNLNLDYPMVTMAFLAHPLDFNAVDGKEVFALFIMLSPCTTVHLTLLSRLSICLQNKEFLSLLKSRAANQEILLKIQKIEEKLDKGSRQNV